MLNRSRGVPEAVALLGRLRRFMPLTGWRMVAIGVGVLLTTVLEGAGVGLLVPLLSLIVGGSGPTSSIVGWIQHLLPGQGTMTLALEFAAGVAVAMALKNGAAFATSALIANIQGQGVQNLRNALFRRLQQAPMEVFERHSPAELSNVFLEEVRRAMDSLAALTGLIQTVGMSLLYVVALVWISPLLALATIACGAAVATLVRRLYRHFDALGRATTAANMQLAHRAAEAFSGVRVVRATNAQRVMELRFDEANAAQAHAEEVNMRHHGMLLPLVEAVSVTLAMALILGAFTLLVEPGHISRAALMGFGLVLLRLVPLVNRFFGSMAQVVFLAGGAREVLKWLDTPAFPSRPFGTRSFTGVHDAVEIRNVSFSYSAERDALHEVSFRLPAGKTVALVGQSGSGKTTLAMLLMRLREPGQGQVIVDGVDYRSFSPESWHQHVALVEQEPFLFSDTLAHNVTFGHDGATDEDILRALHAAHLDDLLATLPEGLQTEIGERGTLLSGGQRQRLAIARAMVRDPQLLILDEATSHLDTVSEALVQAALADATHGRTTLVIAHRLSTVRRADQIVVLENGRVAEAGTWETLAAANGAFAKLLKSGFGA
jgi:ABC-type multidrug transport system fused ATPase/permease subunit